MYAQTNYSQLLGTGPTAGTIAQYGCFLTAFCNLLSRFGEGIDPPTLNNYFVQHGSYIVEADGTRDWLAWGTVSAYDGQVAVSGTGTGWPNTNDAIVKFIYRNSRGGTVTHFCLVADHSAQTIVDSWDGVTKKSPYGQPVEWASYQRHSAQPVVVAPQPTPASSAPFTIENIPETTKQLKIDAKEWDLNRRTWPDMANNPVGSAGQGTKFQTNQIAHHMLGGSYYLPEGSTTQGYNIVDCQDVIESAPVPEETVPDRYTVVKPIAAYGTSNDAANHINRAGTVQAGQYTIFNEAHNMINVTTKPGVAGSWINPSDNTANAPTPQVFTKNSVEGITFEALEGSPKQYFVIKQGGTEKWLFKGVTTWRQFTSVGHVDYGTEIWIAGVAHHPIPPKGADYYMTTDDFGDFKKTGNPTNFYGFNWSDISTIKPPALPAPTPAPVVNAVPAPEPVEPAVAVITPVVDNTAPVDWKETYKEFPKPVDYISTRTLDVQNLDTNKTETLPVSTKVKSYGTVTKDGVEYYRLRTNNDPTFTMWYCVPKLDKVTRTPNLLVAPTTPVAPVNKATIARDSIQVIKEKIELEAPKFLDDIMPKWLKDKK